MAAQHPWPVHHGACGVIGGSIIDQQGGLTRLPPASSFQRPSLVSVSYSWMCGSRKA